MTPMTTTTTTTKIDRVISAARNFSESHFGLTAAASMRIVGLPMYAGDGCERWLVRADDSADTLLVDVELSPEGDALARPYVF